LASVKAIEYAKQLAHWQTQREGIVTVNGDMLAWLSLQYILRVNRRDIYIFLEAIKSIRDELTLAILFIEQVEKSNIVTYMV
jgi:hypothetical protein